LYSFFTYALVVFSREILLICLSERLAASFSLIDGKGGGDMFSLAAFFISFLQALLKSFSFRMKSGSLLRAGVSSSFNRSALAFLSYELRR